MRKTKKRHSFWATVAFCELYGVHPREAPPKLRR